jgi:hypothetical protein
VCHTCNASLMAVMWTVLLGNFDLSRMLWTRCSSPLRAAVMARRLCLRLADSCHLSRQEELRKAANNFEDWAIGTLDQIDKTEVGRSEIDHHPLRHTGRYYAGPRSSDTPHEECSLVGRTPLICSQPRRHFVRTARAPRPSPGRWLGCGLDRCGIRLEAPKDGAPLSCSSEPPSCTLATAGSRRGNERHIPVPPLPGPPPLPGRRPAVHVRHVSHSGLAPACTLPLALSDYCLSKSALIENSFARRSALCRHLPRFDRVCSRQCESAHVDASDVLLATRAALPGPTALSGVSCTRALLANTA